jgi:hypothetical protein
MVGSGELEHLTHNMYDDNYEDENLILFLGAVSKNARTLKVIRLILNDLPRDTFIKIIDALDAQGDTKLEKIILNYSVSITKNRKVY